MPDQTYHPEAKNKSRPLVLNTVKEIIDWRRTIGGSVGFVPTMGALHEGHATLLRKLRSRVDSSVLSIFVNPAQFGPQEDLSRYPRTFANDLKIAESENVDIVFAPSPEDIYPPNYSTYVEELATSQVLCGHTRPGHFRGVTTVVLKFFNLVRPELALFGLKDAQQFFVLDKMTRDLNLEIKLEGITTVREADGLALSSRNAYLSPSDRERAPLLYRSLQMAQNILAATPSTEHTSASTTKLLEPCKDLLTRQGFRVQYLECYPLPTLQGSLSLPIRINEKAYLIAAAAYLGSTRLIDNIIVGAEELRRMGIHLEG
jgi:pantoate--beta-alanine ligase